MLLLDLIMKSNDGNMFIKAFMIRENIESQRVSYVAGEYKECVKQFLIGTD